MKDNKDILIQVKNNILKVLPDAQIYLFGSRARKDNYSDSDWDFLILTQEKVNQSLKNKINDVLFETELETDEIMTSIIQNKTLWEEYSMTPIYKNIKREGLLL